MMQTQISDLFQAVKPAFAASAELLRGAFPDVFGEGK